MIKEFLGVIYDKIYYLGKIAVSYDNFWVVIGIVAASGFLFFLFLKTPKV